MQVRRKEVASGLTESDRWPQDSKELWLSLVDKARKLKLNLNLTLDYFYVINIKLEITTESV